MNTQNLLEAVNKNRIWISPLRAVALVLVFCAAATSTFAVLNQEVPAGGEVAAAATTSITPEKHAFDTVTVQAKSAYVIDLTDNRVLYQKDPVTARPLASITKVATALVAAEVLPLNQVITIPFDTAPAGSTQRLAKGDRWRVSDVMTFTLVSSSNEGATILAHAAEEPLHEKYPDVTDDGAASVTIWRMNDLAHSLNLTTMSFSNPSGLDESASRAGAYGSAKDVAALFAYASTHAPGVFAGTAIDGVTLTSVDGTKTAAFNTDEAINAIPGLVMGKTGTTDLAGGNLAIVFDVGPSHPVAAVVLGSTPDGRFEDMKTLVAAAQKELSDSVQ